MKRVGATRDRVMGERQEEWSFSQESTRTHGETQTPEEGAQMESGKQNCGSQMGAGGGVGQCCRYDNLLLTCKENRVKGV